MIFTDQSREKLMHSSELVNERESGFASRLRQGCVLLPLFVSIGFSPSMWSQGSVSSAVAPLRLMPLPRSVETGAGHLVVDSHFKAAITGDHDARLDAALDRMIMRLDRQCGEIRRSQYGTASTGSPI